MHHPLALYNVLVVILTGLVTWQACRKEEFLEKLLFDPEKILRYGEYHRLFTSGLIHADWLHYMFNMFSLFAFGEYIELIFGPGPFLLIYISGILGGNLLSLYLHRHHDYQALGASGGVCGIIFASIFLLPGGDVHPFMIPIGIPAWTYAILFLLFSFVGMRRQRSNIGHDAHLGGALVGLLTTTALYPYIADQQRILYLAVWAITGALFYYAYRNPVESMSTVAHPSIRWRGIRSRTTTAQFQRGGASPNQLKIDRLLDKISAKGINSLSWRERQQLARLSRLHNK